MHHSPITTFINSNFLHFNAASLRSAAEAYRTHVEKGGKMFLALGGALSTAEIGITLAEMIRKEKVHAISCTGANLEEDLFNLIAHGSYRSQPAYRELTPHDDNAFFGQRLNRVTDTCIPDDVIWNLLERPFREAWTQADRAGLRFFPHEFVFKVLASDGIKNSYQINPANSWLIAAMERGVPIFVPAWEDSSLGNMYAAACIRGELKNVGTVRSGIEAMVELASWYTATSTASPIGFFQIGGGAAGDFPICVVPMLHDDLLRTDIPKWSYYCQIGDSTTSYGSYSGASPSEKISWGKLDLTTPRYAIESDATIVAPLIFAYVLGW